MIRMWKDAVGILETASGQQETAGSDFAILLDHGNSIRIVDAVGWRLEALQTEYQAGTAFLVKRTSTSVRVEAQSGVNHCALQTTLVSGSWAALTGGVAPHLIRPESLSLTSSR
jgi:hypothetical protein